MKSRALSWHYGHHQRAKMKSLEMFWGRQPPKKQELSKVLEFQFCSDVDYGHFFLVHVRLILLLIFGAIQGYATGSGFLHNPFEIGMFT